MKYFKKIITSIILIFSIFVANKINVNAENISKEWKYLDGNWYYYINEVLQDGWVNDNGKWYYLEPDGQMVIGWSKLDNNWYYFNESGTMATEWLKLDNNWYYLNKGGTMATGWLKLDNNWYYFNKGGTMATGWLKLDNNWYYFNKGGTMAANIEIGCWKIGSNGVALPSSIILDVPVINQHSSGLKYGCEAMATLMALKYKTNQDFDNYKFGMSIPMDKTPLKTTRGYSGVYQWGDPDVGFVGDITGKKMGSTIYPKPLTNYLKEMGHNQIDLSGCKLDLILDEVRKGNPVVAWVSLNMNTPNDWKTWKTPEGKQVKVTFSAHSVTITGVDDTYVYYNDSWTGTKNKKISKVQFEKVYNWRGSRALVIK